MVIKQNQRFISWPFDDCYQLTCLYVCMYVCMYVFMNVFMNVCMNVCMNGMNVCNE